MKERSNYMNDRLNVEPTTETAVKLRGEFLAKSRPVINAYIRVALGEGALKSTDRKVSDKVFDAVIPMLQKEGDVQRIQAESAQDVLGLIRDGLISIVDAKDLMHLLSTKSDIEDMKTLLEKMEALDGSNQGQ